MMWLNQHQDAISECPDIYIPLVSSIALLVIGMHAVRSYRKWLEDPIAIIRLS